MNRSSPSRLDDAAPCGRLGVFAAGALSAWLLACVTAQALAQDAPAPIEAPAAASEPAPAASTLPQTPPSPDDGAQPVTLGKGELLLNFREAELQSILDYLSEQAGLIVVSNVELDGNVTLVNRQPVKLDEAVGLLNSVLKDKGFAAIRRERALIASVAE